MTKQDFKLFDDKMLMARLVEMADGERVTQVEIIRLLIEVDDRDLHFKMGYSSMWDYCRRALGFSESVSQQRMVVARAARKWPALLEGLADGRLTICTAADLVPALRYDNVAQMLAAAVGKSRNEVKDLVSATGGKPAAARDLIRLLPVLPDTPAASPRSDVRAASLGSETRSASPREVAAGKASAVESTSEHSSLAVAQLRVAFTASADVVEKLKRVQELLGGAKLEAAVGKAADALLEKLDPVRREARRETRRQAVEIEKPRARRVTISSSNPGRPPAEMRDQVMVDDGRQCSYVSPEGVRCAETRFLTIDHVRPFALGGTSLDRSNLRCLCAAHNRFLGRRTFGPRAL